MIEEPTPVPALDEQLDLLLHPLGVCRDTPSLEEQLNEELDRLLHPFGVRRETSIDTQDRPEREERAGVLRVHLHFFSVLCEWSDAPRLKERLEQLLQSAEATSADVLPGVSRQQRCYFMIVALAPFPPDLFDQLREWREVRDSFDFTTALDLVSDSDDTEGAAGV